jgi:prepilin-type N-terminal cleavage/methylation domain-containing protein
LAGEAGYSLVEVMVAIMILAIAIIPMVGMFDAGLRAATQGGDYDRARALANAKMEDVRALSYKDLVATYPPGRYPPSTPGCSTGTPGFACTISTNYVNPSLQSDSSASASSSNGMQIEVTVTWNNGNNSFTTTGLKTRGQPE